MLPLADASLLPAIFGLLGVTVGVVLTGIVEWIRESRRDADRARAAARLLRADILIVSRIVEKGIETRELPGFLDIGVPSWREYRDVFASALDGEAWAKVSIACSRLQMLADVQEQSPRWSRGRLKDDAMPMLDKVVTDLVAAYDALGPLAGDTRSYYDVAERDAPVPNELGAVGSVQAPP
jgi:hypothetical protein